MKSSNIFINYTKHCIAYRLKVNKGSKDRAYANIKCAICDEFYYLDNFDECKKKAELNYCDQWKFKPIQENEVIYYCAQCKTNYYMDDQNLCNQKINDDIADQEFYLYKKSNYRLIKSLETNEIVNDYF